jgi:hypothetical protein
MSKSKINVRKIERDYVDEETNYHNKLQDKEKRKNKRLVNVLRSKNIAGLLEMEEDEEYD